MNLMYISPMKIDRNNLDGVAKKILFQVKAFQKCANINTVYLASFFENDKYLIMNMNSKESISISYKYKSSKQLNLLQIYPEIFQYCKKYNIKAVYFRVFSLNMVTNKLFKKFKNNNIQVVIEIPTYPFWQEKWKDVIYNLKKCKIKTALNRTLNNICYFIYAHNLRGKVSKIVTFSNIKKLWGIDVLGISNGYNFDKRIKNKKFKKNTEDLRLIVVASVRNNHGIDRLIKGLSLYNKNNNKRKIYIDIVGEGDEVPILKSLIFDLGNVDQNIKFHGFKSGKELEKLYQTSDIGISALGFHRLNIHYVSPLKSKEYFANGLPVIGTYAEQDIINSPCSPFFYSFPEDDSAINIEKIIEFYDNLATKNSTNQIIMNVSKKCFDWENIMKFVYKNGLDIKGGNK